MCANENKPLVARIGVQPVAANTTFAARTAILPLTAGVHRTVATDDLSGRTSCTGQKCRPIAVHYRVGIVVVCVSRREPLPQSHSKIIVCSDGGSRRAAISGIRERRAEGRRGVESTRTVTGGRSDAKRTSRAADTIDFPSGAHCSSRRPAAVYGSL